MKKLIVPLIIFLSIMSFMLFAYWISGGEFVRNEALGVMVLAGGFMGGLAALASYHK